MDSRTTWFNYYIIYKFHKMNEKKALEVLKAALDLGVAKGNYQNLNETLAVIESWNVIAKKFEIEKQDETNNGAD